MLPGLGADRPHLGSHPARQGVCRWTIRLGKGEPPALLRPVLTKAASPWQGQAIGVTQPEGPRPPVRAPPRGGGLDSGPPSLPGRWPAQAREGCGWAEGDAGGPGQGGWGRNRELGAACPPSCNRDGHGPGPSVAQETKQRPHSLPNRNSLFLARSYFLIKSL